MRRALVLLSIILAAMLVCGCCAGCPLFDPSTRRALYADDYAGSSNNSTVFGIWSTSNTSPVDPGIAFDSWYGPFSDGQWYIIKESGYFKYVNMSTEAGARGGLYRYGSLDVRSNDLLLSNTEESYYPGPNSRQSPYEHRAVDNVSMTYDLPDNNTLILRGEAGSGTYYRVA